VGWAVVGASRVVGFTFVQHPFGFHPLVASPPHPTHPHTHPYSIVRRYRSCTMTTRRSSTSTGAPACVLWSDVDGWREGERDGGGEVG